jgi:lipoprotein-anchoring transpeptidase ErfK/SrfK
LAAGGVRRSDVFGRSGVVFSKKLMCSVVLALSIAASGPAHAEGFFAALARALGAGTTGTQTGPQATAYQYRSPRAPITPPAWQSQYRSQSQAMLFPGAALYPDQVSPARVVPAQFRRQTVSYPSNEKPGTLVVDSRNHFLYYVLGNNQAVRYGVGVGRSGFAWNGTVRVASKAEWPGWTPPPAMIARERARGHILPAYMPGGQGNPLGARALYLHNGGGDTGYRIHGTSEPWTIGLDVSSGCIRLVNDDVIDLYQRVGIGTKVIVM